MNTPRPTVLLGMINDAGIAKVMAECLRFHGFEVLDFSLDSLDFRYPNLAARLGVQIKKLLGSKEAKKELMVALKRRSLGGRPSETDRFDYALFVRSDVYPERFIREIRNQAAFTANYQWDGLSRFAAAGRHIALFDRFYVFDPADLAADSRVLPASSFYFDHLGVPPEGDGSIYYLGAHREDRLPQIARFYRHARQQGWQTDFQIACPKQEDAPQHYPEGIRFHQGIGFAENLRRARSCSVLADFVISSHKGLSLRTFEALGYGKKLITTNAEVEKYDFYHPDNIFIWDGGSFDGIAEFLATPYRTPAPEILEKYSFGNWVRYILNITPHIPVCLPPSDKAV